MILSYMNMYLYECLSFECKYIFAQIPPCKFQTNVCNTFIKSILKCKKKLILSVILPIDRTAVIEFCFTKFCCVIQIIIFLDIFSFLDLNIYFLSYNILLHSVSNECAINLRCLLKKTTPHAINKSRMY